MKTKTNCEILWNRHFAIAKKFYLKHGHLQIPNNYTYKNIKLGRWIGTQRYDYKKRKNPYFTKKRIKKLESIGMIWDAKQIKWEKMYNELKTYKNKFNTTRIPQSYVTKDGLKLGRSPQRSKHPRHPKKFLFSLLGIYL